MAGSLVMIGRPCTSDVSIFLPVYIILCTRISVDMSLPAALFGKALVLWLQGCVNLINKPHVHGAGIFGEGTLEVSKRDQ